MISLLNEYPVIRPVSLENNPITLDKGTQIMEGMLLDQYNNSNNLKEYFNAFIAELDFLFEQTERVYFGRFIETAVGTQLDIIGDILQQSRTVILPKLYFGFQGALNVDGMTDEATPARGGIFKDEAEGEGLLTPLSDNLYRRMLIAKAALINRDSIDISLVYHILSLLLDKVPKVFELRTSESGTGLGQDNIELTITRDEITSEEIGLILYMSKYFIPTSKTFTITQV